MIGQTIAFYIIAVSLVFTALYIVTTKNVMHAVFTHLLAMTMIAGIYVLLYAEFLAAMQILVYAGAVTIMVVFALMLVRNQGTPMGTGMVVDNKQKLTSLIAVAMFAGLALASVLTHKWTAAESVSAKAAPSVTAMGKLIFGSYVLPFEIISVLLLAALIGVVVLAGKER